MQEVGHNRALASVDQRGDEAQRWMPEVRPQVHDQALLPQVTPDYVPSAANSVLHAPTGLHTLEQCSGHLAGVQLAMVGAPIVRESFLQQLELKCHGMPVLATFQQCLPTTPSLQRVSGSGLLPCL